MSGSSESNEDLVAGRVNRSNNQTTIWAENNYGLGIRVLYEEPAIFLVEVAKDSENEGTFEPLAAIDAIHGVGWSGKETGGTGVTGIGGEVNGRGVLGDAGGDATGVVGLGGPQEGTGVFGLGSGGERAGLQRRGHGGTGVHGVGGPASLQPGRTDVLPGVGVFGQGGQILDTNTDRRLLGTGVIGVGGDADNKDMPLEQNAGSAGVFGQGANAEIIKFSDGGAPMTSGPAEPGAGVVGRGGAATGTEFPHAAGVIGLAGGHDKPDITKTNDSGVFGLGSPGVHGEGIDGYGVRGTSAKDRGGVFSSDHAAQVRLIPAEVRTTLPEGSAVTPLGISDGSLSEGVVSLPRDGRGGDLMALEDDSRRCTLWFCVRSGRESSPAQWAQVLLGTAFDGQA